MHPVGVLIRTGRTNAIVGWALAGSVCLSAVERVLADAYLWGGFTLLVAAVIVLPAAIISDWTAMVPWPLLLLTSLAVGLRSLGPYPELAGYVTVAVLALIIVFELDTFTRVDMSRRFAVAFAVLTTMALQGLWTIAQFYSDRWLGTGFIPSQTELQWDFVIVTVVGGVLGTLVQLYLASGRGLRRSSHPPDSAEQ